ncbi:hypothetical protein BG006_010754 [Podila minutissima]|uniref:Uncharacterized protein n=1 Tax=Podila minutissima TaxID=64525 RepID=A0A9P5VIE7_9FUNG|nr:hypothetical protein BG006_010754 [Podila minutissima]
MTMQVDNTPASSTTTATKLTRLCDAVSEHYYIYLTIEMESQDATKKGSNIHLSILTLRAMLTSAVQDLFGSAMGGGINIDILGFWTDSAKDPYNRLIATSPGTPTSSNIPASTATTTTTTAVSVKPTFSPTTAGSAVVRCHALDLNQLWNALTLFNTLVNDYEARFEIRHVASTLLGLQANSRQLVWEF